MVGLLIIMPMLKMNVTGLDNPITTLGNSSSEEIITFPKGGGYNNELNLTLPEGAIITAAQLDVQGFGVLGSSKPYTHTFQDTVNNNAWKGATTQHPPTANPTTFTTTAFTNSEYTNIRTSDNTRAIYSTRVMNNYPYHLFRFKVTEINITNVNVYWEGYGTNKGPSIWPYWAYLYIWNSTGSTWESVGSNNSNINPVDFIIQKSVSNQKNYINSSNFIHLMAQGPQVAGNLSTSDIQTDFVKVVITGDGVSYPTNPTLNVGDDGDTEWIHAGIFDKSITIDDNMNFKSELQSLIDSAEPGCVFVDVPLNFTSSTQGKLKISNISISYKFPEVNLPPIHVKDLANSTLGFYEDTDDGNNLIDLNDYFWDDRDNGSLTFSILKNDIEVEAELDSDGHHLDFNSQPDFFGTCEFQVRATDKGLDGLVGFDVDLSTDSNVFTVTVWPTNDAPVIDSIDNITISDDITELEFLAPGGAIEDEWFNKTVIGHDIDGDTLSFSCNLTLLQPSSIDIKSDPINANKAQLSIYAANDNVGILKLSITVSDNNESSSKPQGDPSDGPLTDSIDLTIEVVNSNDRPILNPVGVLSCDEDAWFNFTLTATDDDLIHGDKLKFLTNLTTAVKGLTKNHNFNFDEDTGKVSILPDNDMVGSYWVSFGVKDLKGASDVETVMMVINNVNDPPVAVISSPVVEIEFNTSTQIYFDASESSDVDLIHGDSLSYSWSSNISGELSTKLSFYTNLTDVGWHEITLTVTDSSNERDQKHVLIQVTAIPKKPIDKPGDGDGGDGNGDGGNGDGSSDEDDSKKLIQKEGDKSNFDNLLVMIIILITIIVVVTLILIFLWQRKRAKDKAMPESDSETERVNADAMADSVLPVQQFSGQPLQTPTLFTQPMPQAYPQTMAQPMMQPMQLPLAQAYTQQPMAQPMVYPMLQQQPIPQQLTLPPVGQPVTEPQVDQTSQTTDIQQNQENP